MAVFLWSRALRQISAHSDGGPCSWVWARLTLRSALINMSRNLSAQVSGGSWTSTWWLCHISQSKFLPVQAILRTFDYQNKKGGGDLNPMQNFRTLGQPLLGPTLIYKYMNEQNIRYHSWKPKWIKWEQKQS